MKDWKTWVLVLAVAVVSGTSAHWAAMASTRARLEVLDAKAAHLATQLQLARTTPAIAPVAATTTEPVPEDRGVVGRGEYWHRRDARPIPKPRAFLIH